MWERILCARALASVVSFFVRRFQQAHRSVVGAHPVRDGLSRRSSMFVVPAQAGTQSLGFRL